MSEDESPYKDIMAGWHVVQINELEWRISQSEVAQEQRRYREELNYMLALLYDIARKEGLHDKMEDIRDRITSNSDLLLDLYVTNGDHEKAMDLSTILSNWGLLSPSRTDKKQSHLNIVGGTDYDGGEPS